MKAVVIHLLKSFWLAKMKLVLCLVAATLSAWGISTIIYGYLMTERDFIENFEQSNPASIVLTLQGGNTDIIEQLKDTEGVLDIERREAVAGRIKSINGGWMPIIIFGAEKMNAPRISQFDLEDAKNYLPTSLFIERSGKGFIEPSADSLIVQVPGFRTISFPFSGYAHDPGQAPSQMEQALYGFTQIENLEPYLKENQKRYLVSVHPSLVDQLDFEQTARQLIDKAKQNYVVASVAIPPPGEHPHQGIVDGISFLQKSFGIILSLLGAILLSLILITWIYPQLVNVGIMKAIGASGQIIFLAYFVVLLLIILTGIAVGLPFGYKAGKLYSGSVAFIQNFTPIREPLPFFYHVMVALPVIAIPLLFSFIPLWKSSRTSVQNSLNQVFYTPYKTAFKFTQRLINTNVIKYSVNNLFRSSQRTSLLFILMASGVALFTAGVNLKYSLKADFYKYAEDAGYDIDIVFKDTMRNKLSFIESLPFVEKQAYVRLRTVQYKLPNYTYDEGSTIRLLPPEYEFEKVRLVKGELKRNCPNCLYITQQYEQDFSQLLIGSEFEITNGDLSTERYVYSGIIKDISHPGFYVFNTKRSDVYNEMAVKIKAGFSSQEAARQIDDVFLDHDIDVRQITDIRTRLLALENHLAPMFLVIQLMGAGTVLIALGGFFIVLSLSMQERAREMGIMKALGGTIHSIINVYYYEYMIVAFLSVILGSIGGYVLNSVICSLFGVMVTKSPVPPLIDFKFMALTATTLFLIQILMITLYVRYKITSSSSRLLSDVF